MDTLQVVVDIPRTLLGALDISVPELSSRVRELIALELFREGRISSGTAAEFLGITKLAFISLLARHHIPYFSQTPAELVEELATLEQLLR